MKFKVTHKSKKSLARVGLLSVLHGDIPTPVFMPVGTQGVVKTLSPWELEEIGATIILGNTYHLHLRPGDELIKSFGGIQKWSSWNKPVLTDSGGYQAFSLAKSKARLARINDEGVTFFSHYDGKKVVFTPEKVIDIQINLNSDILMVLDDCAPYPASEKRLDESVARTFDWAKKSVDYFRKLDSEQTLFGIIQGGMSEEKRLLSCQQIQSLPFDGIAVGGVSVGEGKSKMLEAVDYLANSLDSKRPHYLMGVGEPTDLIKMVSRGIDMFDCVLATRIARHGSFWTGENYNRFSIKLSRFENNPNPIDRNCQCKICQKFSLAYLRHLYLVKDPFAARALSYHNLWVLHRLMDKIRDSISQDSFESEFKYFLSVD